MSFKFLFLTFSVLCFWSAYVVASCSDEKAFIAKATVELCTEDSTETVDIGSTMFLAERSLLLRCQTIEKIVCKKSKSLGVLVQLIHSNSKSGKKAACLASELVEDFRKQISRHNQNCL